jgi:exopolysaccharide biosynthesis polyprenyl glycosylphosphotransferase
VTTTVVQKSGPYHRPSPHKLRLESSRTGLQQRAAYNTRRHIVRSAFRAAVLMAGDATVFLIARALVRLLRDSAILGDSVAVHVAAVIPKGLLGGWAFVTALLVGLTVTGNYHSGDRRRDPSRLFLGVLLATALTLWETAWNRGSDVVAMQFIAVTLTFAVAMTVERMVLDWVVRAVKRGREAQMGVLIGRPDECDTLAVRHISEEGEFTPLGFVDTAHPPHPDALGSLRDLRRILETTPTEAVLLCGYMDEEDFADVIETASIARCQLLSVPRALRAAGVKPTLVWRGGHPVIELTAATLDSWQMLIKRLIDFTASAVGLAILAPVMVLAALAIKLDSRGPVFFRQWRVGRAGRQFQILKFRSMVIDAEERRSEVQAASIYGDQRLFKAVSDPRITSIGSWLRKTSLDEIPQLINVLKGDMSLVGPRPPLPSEVALYEEHHYCRFDMKPGMTGPWQVSGRNRITDFEEIVRLEGAYMRNWSIFRDIRILLRTVPAVLKMDGAH